MPRTTMNESERGPPCHPERADRHRCQPDREMVRVPADLPSPIRYHAVRPSLAGWNAIRSIETASVPHASRRRGGRVAARGARAAGGDAGGRVSQCHIARWMAAHGECIHGASKLRPPKKPVELLAAGHGYRCEIGDCVNVEVERLED